MITVYIGLGSNLADPLQQLTIAIESLRAHPDIIVSNCSSYYQSKALTLDDTTQPDYFNAVVEVKTLLNPEALLDKLHEIENQQGRIRKTKWGARTLDLDILLYGQEEIVTERLKIPHPHMCERNFVLFPLYEINPVLVIPTFGKLSAIIENISMDGLKKDSE